MGRHSVRVLAAAVATAALAALPLWLSARSAAPLNMATAALRPAADFARLDFDQLLHRPDPTPSPTPSPTPAPAPTRAPVAQTDLKPRPTPVPLPDITADEGLLVDTDAGRTLWARNPYATHPVASLAKMFTDMVAVNLMSLDRPLTVPSAITGLPWDSTLMGLTPGETLSVRELLDGSLLVSGNDAALTLSMGVTSESTFVSDMNGLAWSIGLRHTHFVNPVGLDDAAQYSSAADLATTARYLDRHYPLLASIADTIEIDLPATATHKAYQLHNLDKLLWEYPGVTGLKGGYTGLAGGCLVTTAVIGGHHFVAVLLGSPPLPSPGAFADMKALLNYAAALLRASPNL